MHPTGMHSCFALKLNKMGIILTFKVLKKKTRMTRE